jgi:hypothetical protein
MLLYDQRARHPVRPSPVLHRVEFRQDWVEAAQQEAARIVPAGRPYGGFWDTLERAALTNGLSVGA